jgi:hypothetical protein
MAAAHKLMKVMGSCGNHMVNCVTQHKELLQSAHCAEKIFVDLSREHPVSPIHPLKDSLLYESR